MAELVQSEIENNSHPFLHTYSRKICSILPNFYVRKCNTEKLSVSPVHYFLALTVYHCPNYITGRPLFPVSLVCSIPFFHTITIICVRISFITNTICGIKNRLKLTPTNLSKTVSHYCHLVVETTFKNCCVCSNRDKSRSGLNIKTKFI